MVNLDLMIFDEKNESRLRLEEGEFKLPIDACIILEVHFTT